MAVKDGERTLSRAIGSTLRAMPSDAELVVLDDGSRDRTPEVLASISDPRLRTLANAVSMGVGRAGQALLAATDSEFIARMDADDVCLPWRFLTESRELRRADVVVTPVVRFREGSRFVRPGMPLPITAAAMPFHLMVHNGLSHPTLAARRSAVESVGGYRDAVAEDYDLWLRLVAAGRRLVRSATPTLAYRIHSKQLSLNAQFDRRAREDALLRQSYRDFVLSRFGVEATWLDWLWSGGSTSGSTEYPVLRDLLHRGASELGWQQRVVLGRTTRLLELRV